MAAICKGCGKECDTEMSYVGDLHREVSLCCDCRVDYGDLVYIDGKFLRYVEDGERVPLEKGNYTVEELKEMGLFLKRE